MAAPVAASEATAGLDGGALVGMVTFTGRMPALKPLTVMRSREVCGEQKPAEALVLGKSQAVQGSVVMVEGVTRGKKETGDRVVETRGCTFVPHVTAAMPGDRVRVRNSDAVVHNTHALLGRSTVFNVAMPGKDQMIDVSRRITGPGVVRVVCDAHPHMQAWLVLHDNPYFAVTDERGAFRIDGIPPGTYRVTMWHEGFRPQGMDRDGRPAYGDARTVSRQVTIAARADTVIDFELR